MRNLNILKLFHQEREAVYILQRDGGTLSHTVQWILGDMEWDVDLVLKSLVETAEQSTTT